MTMIGFGFMDLCVNTASGCVAKKGPRHFCARNTDGRMISVDLGLSGDDQATRDHDRKG